MNKDFYFFNQEFNKELGNLVHKLKMNQYNSKKKANSSSPKNSDCNSYSLKIPLLSLKHRETTSQPSEQFQGTPPRHAPNSQTATSKGVKRFWVPRNISVFKRRRKKYFLFSFEQKMQQGTFPVSHKTPRWIIQRKATKWDKSSRGFWVQKQPSETCRVLQYTSKTVYVSIEIIWQRNNW